MKLIQILEIIFIIKVNFGLSCKIPNGLKIIEDEILMTLACQNSSLIIHFNETSRQFTKTEKSYRAICEENKNLEILYPNFNGVIFCAEENCLLPKSLNQSEKLLRYFSDSVITTNNQSEIYYCFNSMWYSIFQTDLPEDFKLINEMTLINMKSTNIQKYKLLPVVETIHENEQINNKTVELEAELQKPEENGLKNHSFLFKFNSEHPKTFNLIEFVIICLMVCLFFFFLLVLLILLSKFALISQVRRKFIKPNLLLIESEALVINNKSFVNNKDFPVLREKMSSSESSAESKTTIYTSPSKHSKNIEANENS